MVTATITDYLQRLYQDLVRDNVIKAKTNNKAIYFLKGVENIGAKHCLEDFVKKNDIPNFSGMGGSVCASDYTIVYMLNYWYQGEDQVVVYAKHEVRGYNGKLDLLAGAFPDLWVPPRRTEAAALEVKNERFYAGFS